MGGLQISITNYNHSHFSAGFTNFNISAINKILYLLSKKNSINSIINLDSWRGYNSLMGLGHKRYYRVHHSKSEFVKGNSYINGI
jgi:hypothetical protein